MCDEALSMGRLAKISTVLCSTRVWSTVDRRVVTALFKWSARAVDGSSSLGPIQPAER